MTADSQLEQAYREWRRLAEAESKAIRAGNWALATDCQTALRQLQSRITLHTQKAQNDIDVPAPERTARAWRFRAVIEDLIRIESENAALMKSARQLAEGQISRLRRAGRTLRRVQQSYARADRAAWTSFS